MAPGCCTKLGAAHRVVLGGHVSADPWKRGVLSEWKKSNLPIESGKEVMKEAII